MEHRKKIGKRIISLVLSLSMIFSVMLTMVPAMEVKAAGGYYSDVLYSEVHFDGKDWYLIEDNSTTDANTGTVTLLSKDCVAASAYNSADGENSKYVDYNQSTVKEAVDAYYNNDDNISIKAKNAVDGNRMFLLTKEQAKTIEDKGSDVRREVLGCNQYTDAGDSWWLSSMGKDEKYAASVFCSSGYPGEYQACYLKHGVRPALKLKLEAVNFLSDTKTFSLETPVSSVSISPNAAQTININSTVAFTATVSPDNATDKKVIWSVNNDKVKLYSDSACTTEVGTGATSTFTVYAKGVSAGSSTVTVTSNSDDSKSASCSVTVNKYDSTAPTLTGYSGTYDKAAHSITVSGGSGGTINYSTDKSNWSTTKPTRTDAGKTTVFVKIVGDDTHNDSSVVSADIDISPKVVGLTWADTSFTYDGSAHKPTATATGLISGTTCTVTVSGEQTNEGTHTATARSLSNTNYKLPNTNTTNFTIGKKDATITASAQTITYGETIATGTDKVTVTGLVSSDTLNSITLTPSTSDATTNGTIKPESATIKKGSTDVTSNYNITYRNGALTINKASGAISYAQASVAKRYGDEKFTNALTNTGNGAVTYASGNTDVATVNSETGQVTIVGVGEAVITATASDGSNYTYADADKTASYTLTVSKALAPSYSDLGDGQKPTGKTNLKYTGSPQDIVTAPSEPPTGYTVEYSDDNGTRWSTSIPKKTDKGEYTVKVRYVGDANHTDFDGDDITVNIAKKDALNPSDLTDGQKPTGKTGLKYTSEPQDLVTEPTELSTGYTKVQYSKDGGSTWTDEIPTGTETGDYTVKVKYIGDDNHTDFVGTDILVTIAKKDAPELTDGKKPTGNTGLKYTGEPQKLVTAPTEALPNGYTKVQYSKDGGATWTDEIPEETEAGDYTVKVKYIGDDNHADFEGDDIPVAIGKKDAPDVADLTNGQKPTGKTELKYTGEPQPLVEEPTGELPDGYTKVQYSKDGGTTWTDEIPTGTEAGDYTVKVKYVGDDNHTDFEGDDIPVTIGKKDAPDVSELTDEQKPTGKPDVTFTGEPQAIAEAPSELPDGYTKVQYSIDDGETWTDEIPKMTDAGDYTVKTKYIGDNNHTDFMGSDIPVTIDRMTLDADDVTVTFSSDSYGYTGNEVKPVPTITIKSGGKVLDSSDFDIIYTNNTEVGTATITIVTKDGANYVFGTGDKAPKTTFVIRLGEKEINTDVRKDDKSPEVKAANLTDEFAESTLSDEEKALIDNAVDHGKSVDIDLYLDIKDISDTISTSDKEKIKAYATNTDNIAFFDISLFKEIIISGQSQGATSIHELTTPLKLTIGVPKSFPAVADGYTRTYEVIRLHDGNVEKLPTTLNADGTITFETDKFSTYALAYTDKKKENTTTDAPTTKVDTPSTKAPKADTKNTPDTGDKMNIGLVVMLMLSSGLAAIYLTLRRKRIK